MRLPRLFKRRESLKAGELFATDGPYSGLFVGWFLDAPSAAALALETDGAVPAEELHVTVCYGGKLDELGDLEIMQAIENARQCIEYSRPMAGVISGVGRFQAASDDEGDLDVIYAGVDVPGLSMLNVDLAGIFTRAGFPEPTHGYTAHITLAYVAPGSPLPVEAVPNLPLNIQSLTINAGRFTADVELGRAFMAMPATFGEGPGDSGRIFMPIQFAEAPPWIPYLPIPGTYSHPRYGEMAFSRERLAHFVEVFNAGSYQSRVPLDAEHETKLSGAVGWITKLRENADGSVDAQVEWTDRGRELIKQDRFRYVSAEFFDEWDSPTGEHFTDVVIGGAICTRPFFKESVLRPLAASETPNETPEEGHMPDNETPPESTTASEPIQFAELQRQLNEERDRNKQLAETVSKMAADSRRRAFTAEVNGKSDANNIRWFGDAEPHIAHLEKLAATFGDDSAEVKHYVDLNRSHAKSLHEAGLFSEIGHSKSGGNSAEAEMESKVRAYQESHPDATKEQAFSAVVEAEPALARRFRSEERGR